MKLKSHTAEYALIPLAAAAGIISAAYGIYRWGFYSPRGKQNDNHRILIPFSSRDQHDRSIELIDKLDAKPYERISITSYDGLKLAGRYYHVKDNAPLAILFHGYRGTPVRDFCGGSDLCFSMGYNVLLAEERAHCSSGGHTITFGVKERYDVLSWTEYAVKRFGEDVKIILGGISMGAGTVLMASGLDLPANVKGILADCPFTSPSEIITEFGKSRKIPMSFGYPLTALAAKLFGGFSLDGADAVEAVRKSKVPILIVHGEADTLVPPEMSLRIAAANPQMVERYTFPGAEHGISYIVDPERYSAILRDFCEKIFSDSESDSDALNKI